VTAEHPVTPQSDHENLYCVMGSIDMKAYNTLPKMHNTVMQAKMKEGIKYEHVMFTEYEWTMFGKK
jgi:hypothetical protein